MKGTVYLVGAGPGDPGLLTVKGQALLRRADVVVYDHLVSPRLLKECSPRVKVVYVGKEAGKHTLRQDAINALLVRGAKAGRIVVRLKGGDPFLFGRGGEEALALAKARVAYEVVPGVTSAIAVPAYAGIPVTHRVLSSSVAMLTGHEDPAKPESVIRWDAVAKACDTVVCLMGVGALKQIASQLIRHGRRPSTPAAVIEWGTTPRQRVVTGTLKTIAQQASQQAIVPPAVLIVGDVVSLRSRLAWFEHRPLAGVRILVTRAADKAESLASQLESLGADVEELPAIELVPVSANGVFRTALTEAAKPDWVFFTSPEGIAWFSRMLKPHRKDVRWLSGCHIGAIGPKTAAAIEQHGLHVDFVPSDFRQEGMLDGLRRRALRGKRALILSAEGSREVLEEGLRARGMRVTKVPIYRAVAPTQMLKGVAALFERPFDLITVTSASCVDHLHEALGQAGLRRRFSQLRFASIGPVTSAAVRARGGRVTVEAKASTIEGLVKALVKSRGRRSAARSHRGAHEK